MADIKEPWNKEEEDEEDELDEANYIAQKDAVLFAIDVSKTMMKPPPPSDSNKVDSDSSTLAAIKCAYQIMQQRIISSPNDMMGVLLFGTEKTRFQDEDGNDRGTLTYPHCYLLSDLNIPAAEDVKALKAIVEDEDEATSLLEPSKEPVSMSNMLFFANQIFTTRAPNFGSRRLFIITDNDDPHAADKNSRYQATVRAKDLYDLGVVIELFPISHPDHEFDRTNFYDDIIYRDPAEEESHAIAPTTFKSSGGGITLLSNLISNINSKQVAKRTLFSDLPFEIGPGLTISVKGYNLLQKQKPARNCFVYLGGEKAQFATSETSKYIEDDAFSGTTDAEIKKAYKFANSQIVFKKEEQKELKTFGTPVLRIIGFKPQSMLPIWASVRKSTFVYPSESDYIGSTRVFSAIWQKLLNDKKMGIAWFIARKNASPLLVAILPSRERFDDVTNVQAIPCGLWLYPLPFADDIRPAPQVPTPVVAPDILVDEMRKIIQQLQLPKATYDPTKYPNPVLQWHFKILQAMALDEELPETPDDKTIPKNRQISKRAGEYIAEWQRILEQQSNAYQKERQGRNDSSLKRVKEEDDEAPKKKIKTEKAGLSGLTRSELKALVAKEALGKHTVVDLKDFLSQKGLNPSGKKQDLVDKVEQWIEEN